jgi:hypothetical protein
MADVFLSYAQRDRVRARQVAEALRELGWDVWWDAHLYVGTRFRAEIARQLESAKCVVVLWSQASTESDWVIDEAQDGKNRGVLVQALVEDVQPPHGFRGIHWANLTSWTGGLQAEEFAKLAGGISRHAPMRALTPTNTPRTTQSVPAAHTAGSSSAESAEAQPRAGRWHLAAGGVAVKYRP